MDSTYPHRPGRRCLCGVSHDEPSPAATPEPARSEASSRSQWAQRIWRAAAPAKGTPVERYLLRRGITRTLPRSLRYALLKHPNGTVLPAMVGAVTRSPSNEVVGVHRTFLTADGTAKADVVPNKMMLGPCGGGAVRLGTPGEVLVVSEGIESGLSVQLATAAPTWAALSAPGMEQLVLPDLPLAGEVVIAADHDRRGLEAADRAAERWLREHRRVRIALPPEGQDFNDMLRAGSGQ